MTIDALFSVRGKTALVTGGSRGIGFMIAEALVRGGARVCISSRNAQACAVRALSAWASAIAAPSDLENQAGVEGLVRLVAGQGPTLDTS